MSKVSTWLLRKLPESARRNIALALVKSDNALVDRMTFKIAKTRDEWEQAFRIIHDAYVSRGLLTPRAAGLYVPIHAILASTTVFIGILDDQVVCTVSLTEDGPLGLPMEKVYPDEVTRWRQTGRRFGEVGALGVARGLGRKGLAFMLYKLLHDWALHHRGLHDLLISTHPNAAIIYRDILLFKPFGGDRNYPNLENAPAAAFRLDFESAFEAGRRIYGTKRPKANQCPMRNPYDFFTLRRFDNLMLPVCAGLQDIPRRSLADLKYFVSKDPQCLENLSDEQAQLIGRYGIDYERLVAEWRAPTIQSGPSNGFSTSQSERYGTGINQP